MESLPAQKTSSCASCGDLATTSLQAQMMPAYATGPGVPGVSLRGSGLQTKLTVGHPHDPYEQEADSVAQRITSGQPVGSISAISPGALKGSAQRQGQEPEVQDEDETLTQTLSLQREAADEDEMENAEPTGELAQPLLQKESLDEDENSEELAQPSYLQRQAADEEEGLSTESEPVEDETVQALFVQSDACQSDGQGGPGT